MTIEEAIPHRPPFLLVDEVLFSDEKSIRTRRKIEADDPVFRGHFPGNPIFPGVLVCESIFQSGAILAAQRFGGVADDALPVLTRISNARFKHPVRPGDSVEIEVGFKEQLSNVFFFTGRARVNGKLSVSVDFACAAVPRTAL